MLLRNCLNISYIAVSAAPRNDMSFDMSGLVEGIFESEAAEIVEPNGTSVRSTPRSVEPGPKNPTSSPMPQPASGHKKGGRFNVTSEEDIFGESLADISAIENLERAAMAGSPGNNILSPVIGLSPCKVHIRATLIVFLS
jgi:hypothetical protein